MATKKQTKTITTKSYVIYPEEDFENASILVEALSAEEAADIGFAEGMVYDDCKLTVLEVSKERLFERITETKEVTNE